MYAAYPFKLCGYCTESPLIFAQYSQIITIEPFEIRIGIFQSVSECQGNEWW